MRLVYIYNDLGASEHSVEQLTACLRLIYSHKYRVEHINANEIKSGKLLETIQIDLNEFEAQLDSDRKEELKVFMLCLGGGYDLGFIKALGKDGCQQIKEYVERGGNYLGICAGGYFACDSIEFDLNGPLEVVGERALKFFPGKAVGPENKNFKYNDDSGAVAVQVQIQCEKTALKLETCLEQSSFYAYLNGGFHLVPISSQSNTNYRVIATYADSNANGIAIIESHIGKGKCLLSGVHFEFNANRLDVLNQNISSNVYPKLVLNTPRYCIDCPCAQHTNYHVAEILLESSFR